MWEASCHPPSWGRYRQVQAAAAASSPDTSQTSRLQSDDGVPVVCLQPSPILRPASPTLSPAHTFCPALRPPLHLTKHLPPGLLTPVPLRGAGPEFRPWRDAPTPTPPHVISTRLSLPPASSGSPVISVASFYFHLFGSIDYSLFTGTFPRHLDSSHRSTCQQPSATPQFT